MDQQDQTIQPNIPQEPQPVIQPEIPQKSGMPAWVTILITVLAIAVIGGGGYAVYYYYLAPEPIQPSDQGTNNNGVLPTGENINGTADWQMYRNEEYGFEIEVPINWSAYSEYDGSKIVDSPASFPNSPMVTVGILPDLSFQIEFIPNMTISDYRDRILSGMQELAKMQVSSGQIGIKLIKDENIFFLVENNSDLLKIVSFNREYEFNNKIFSSIKFIEPEIDVSDWKVFSNKDYGYEIKIPNSWGIISPFNGKFTFDIDPNKSYGSVILLGTEDAIYVQIYTQIDTPGSASDKPCSKIDDRIIYCSTSVRIESDISNKVLSTFKFIE
ncbi:MAG: hypothetical protein ABIF84_01945 [Patescibacteria group bacterium]